MMTAILVMSTMKGKVGVKKKPNEGDVQDDEARASDSSHGSVPHVEATSNTDILSLVRLVVSYPFVDVDSR